MRRAAIAVALIAAAAISSTSAVPPLHAHRGPHGGVRRRHLPVHDADAVEAAAVPAAAPAGLPEQHEDDSLVGTDLRLAERLLAEDASGGMERSRGRHDHRTGQGWWWSPPPPPPPPPIDYNKYNNLRNDFLGTIGRIDRDNAAQATNTQNDANRVVANKENERNGVRNTYNGVANERAAQVGNIDGRLRDGRAAIDREMAGAVGAADQGAANANAAAQQAEASVPAAEAARAQAISAAEGALAKTRQDLAARAADAARARQEAYNRRQAELLPTKLLAQLEELRRQKTAADAALVDATTRRTNAEQLLQRTREDGTRRVAIATGTRDAATKALSDAIAAAKRAVDSKHNEMELVRTSTAAERVAINETRDDSIAKLRSGLADYVTQMEVTYQKARQEAAATLERVETSKAAMESAEKAAIGAEGEVKTATAELAALRQEVATAAERQRAELAQLEAELAAARAERETVEKRAADGERALLAAQQAAQAAKQRAASAIASGQALAAELNKATAAEQKVADAAKAKLAATQQAAKAAEDAKAAVAAKAAAQAAALKAAKDAAAAQVAGAKEAAETASKDKEAAGQTLGSSQESYTQQMMQADQAYAATIAEAADRRRAAAEKVEAGIASQKGRINAAEERLKAIKTSLETAAAKLANVTRERQAVETSVIEMRANVAAAERKSRDEQVAIVAQRAAIDLEMKALAAQAQQALGKREDSLAAAHSAKMNVAKQRQQSFGAEDELEGLSAQNDDAMIQMQAVAKDNDKLRKYYDAIGKTRGRMAALMAQLGGLRKDAAKVGVTAAGIRNETEWMKARRQVLQDELDDAVRRMERRREMGLLMPERSSAARPAAGNRSVGIGDIRGLQEVGLREMEAEVVALREEVRCMAEKATQLTQDRQAGVSPAANPIANRPCKVGVPASSGGPAPAPGLTQQQGVAATGATAVAAGKGAASVGASSRAGEAPQPLREGAVVWFDPDTGRVVDDKWPGRKLRGHIVQVLHVAIPPQQPDDLPGRE